MTVVEVTEKDSFLLLYPYHRRYKITYPLVQTRIKGEDYENWEELGDDE